MSNLLIPSREAAAPRPAWQTILIRPEMMTLLLLIIGIFVGSQLSASQRVRRPIWVNWIINFAPCAWTRSAKV